MREIIVTKGRQTIEASNVGDAMGIILAYRQNRIVGFITKFGDGWKFHNHTRHTLAHEYSTLTELVEAFKELQFKLH